ncbi:UNVERIFIED_CONTAM: hypothetical protein GTU68_053300 [Idotea baltica]|nr:hypothetical protein [Idotea baltica]
MVDAVLDKKALEVTLLDLREVEEAICDYFLICEGGSPTQVKAIADNIQYRCKHELGEYASTVEGTSVAEWVLVDYFDIVVHVFLTEKRKFYNLEELWGDAKQTQFDEFGKEVK